VPKIARTAGDDRAADAYVGAKTVAQFQIAALVAWTVPWGTSTIPNGIDRGDTARERARGLRSLTLPMVRRTTRYSPAGHGQVEIVARARRHSAMNLAAALA
jgi:hypothetical protein